MLIILNTKKFRDEVEISKKRGKNMTKLAEIIKKLSKKEILDIKYKNHKLKGNFKNRWECHIEPDWLLIYCKTETEIIFERIGSHSDLFK